VLRTRSPLIPGPKPGSPFDLHVLSAPPAFVLSQDQTLRRDSGLIRCPKAPDSTVFLSELAGFGRHPDPACPTARFRAGVSWNVRTETRRTEPRSDEALAFTRCSVLKVRTAHVTPAREKTHAGRAPTDDGSSLARGVNRSVRRPGRPARYRSPDRHDAGELAPADLPYGPQILADIRPGRNPITALRLTVDADATLGQFARALGPAGNKSERFQQRRDVEE
jgi:hypothetical protein